MKSKFRNKLKNWMKKRISFRFHMSIIMLSTIFLGMVSNFLLLNMLGLDHPAFRYPLTILLAYCWFLLFIRIYIKNLLFRSSHASVLDFLDPASGPNGKSSAEPISWTGGGGRFSGAGATGDWGCGEAIGEVGRDVASETVGSSVSGLMDDEAGSIVVIAIGGLLAALIFGSGAYFIWHSPEILSECLVHVIFTSGLRRNMKKFSEAEWLAHMFKVTIWPFVIVFLFSLIAGVVLRGSCPEANNLRDYKVKCWRAY